jgi:hypothetical protein
VLDPGQLTLKPISLKHDVLVTVNSDRTIRPVQRIVVIILGQFIIQVLDFAKKMSPFCLQVFLKSDHLLLG